MFCVILLFHHLNFLLNTSQLLMCSLSLSKLNNFENLSALNLLCFWSGFHVIAESYRGEWDVNNAFVFDDRSVLYWRVQPSRPQSEGVHCRVVQTCGEHRSPPQPEK